MGNALTVPRMTNWWVFYARSNQITPVWSKTVPNQGKTTRLFFNTQSNSYVVDTSPLWRTVSAYHEKLVLGSRVPVGKSTQTIPKRRE